jgi:hypothetical protein
MYQTIISSIATVRYWDFNMPVWVIDVSEEEQVWGDYPDFLNFKVIRSNYHLKHLAHQVDFKKFDGLQLRLLSKPLTTYHLGLSLQEPTIASIDADIFFLKNPKSYLKHKKDEPLAVGRNTGYWRFNKENPKTANAIWLWNEYCVKVCTDYNMFKEVQKVTYRKCINEEAIINYIFNTGKGKNLFINPDKWENFLIWDLTNPNVDTSKIAGLHAIQTAFLSHGLYRGKICLLIREIREMLTSVLGPNRMQDMFDNFVNVTTSWPIADIWKMMWPNCGKML